MMRIEYKRVHRITCTFEGCGFKRDIEENNDDLETVESVVSDHLKLYNAEECFYENNGHEIEIQAIKFAVQNWRY